MGDVVGDVVLGLGAWCSATALPLLARAMVFVK
jgi:hypothetical protein